MLVQQFLVVSMLREIFLLELLDLYQFGVEQFLELSFFFFHLSQFISRVSQLSAQHIYFLFELVLVKLF